MYLLQEPTSGLDYKTAFSLVKTLKNYTEVWNKTVVATIHQPSSQIFFFFDMLLLMCDGHVSIQMKRYHKVPKFSDARKLCCNIHKIQTKRLNLWVFPPKDANGIANSEDPDQTAPLGAV